MGVWETTFGPMTLTLKGATVTGAYASGQGKIEATVEGNSLTGRWAEAPNYDEASGSAGDFRFQIDPGCEIFTGSWRYGSSGPFDFVWNAIRLNGRTILADTAPVAAGP